ncbi:MAG TPA: hypothetical protein VED66_17460 [Candidatus Sulfotelmatobacter sp.]|nr:hypothetical protein [Candidatus Sulfotelmatobacter sp.]
MRPGTPGEKLRPMNCNLLGRSVVALMIVAGSWLMFPAPLSAQISPGPLSKAHASLSGTTQCNTCHQFGTSTPTFKCLDCHKELAEALANKHGYHA